MIFFRPEGAFADAIPYYDKNSGKYFIFYLHDYRDVAGRGIGVDWDLITTSDFVNFEEHGTVIKRGQASERDLFVFTGGILEHENGYSIFYTGFSPFSPERGEPAQVVLKADSKDMLHWKKDSSFVFAAPEGFERDDWRDPFVWKNEEGQFNMLLAARKCVKEPSEVGGVTVLCVSDDLKSWTVKEEFWSPNLYWTHECPDLFELNGRRYLIYSEYSEKHLTRYVVEDNGRWIIPENDSFDGAHFYAAKSAGNGDKRYLFGWLSTLDGDSDEGKPMWGGSLAVRELFADDGGALCTKIPDTVLAAFKGKNVLLRDIKLNGAGGRKFAGICDAPESFKFECRAEKVSGRGKFGIAFTDTEKNCNYCFAVYPDKAIVRAEKIPDVNLTSNLHNVEVNIDAHLKTYGLTLVYENGIAELCVNGKTVLSFRFYPSEQLKLSAFSENCEVEFKEMLLNEYE